MVLRDFAVDPAATTRQAILVLSMEPVPRMNPKFIWKNQVYETGTDIFNFPEGTSPVQLKEQSLDIGYFLFLFKHISKSLNIISVLSDENCENLLLKGIFIRSFLGCKRFSVGISMLKLLHEGLHFRFS